MVEDFSVELEEEAEIYEEARRIIDYFEQFNDVWEERLRPYVRYTSNGVPMYPTFTGFGGLDPYPDHYRVRIHQYHSDD